MSYCTLIEFPTRKHSLSLKIPYCCPPSLAPSLRSVASLVRTKHNCSETRIQSHLNMKHNSTKLRLRRLGCMENRKKLQIGLQKSKARARGYRAELRIPFRTTIRNIRRPNSLSHTGKSQSKKEEKAVLP